MATRNGIDNWAYDHQREFEGDSIHDRRTDPDLTNWGSESRIQKVRPVQYWAYSFAATRYEMTAKIRNWVAVRLARLAAWVAP